MHEIELAYRNAADHYISLFGSSEHVHPDDLAIISRHLSIRDGVVLDLGCGPGHLTGYLQSREVDVIGIDLVSEFVDHARATYPNARFERGSMRELAASDGSVAGILAWYSLIHVMPDDLDDVLAEWRRVMRPGGRLLVGFFDGDQRTPFAHAVAPAHYWPADELAARLSLAGFDEVEREQRAGIDEAGHRPHAAIAAIAR